MVRMIREMGSRFHKWLYAFGCDEGCQKKFEGCQKIAIVFIFGAINLKQTQIDTYIGMDASVKS